MTTENLPAQARPLSTQAVSVFESESSFAVACRMARALSSSNLVPAAYRGEDGLGNALIAMDMANRMRLSPMVVMQNMHVIEGRPSWASSFIISALNSSGLFSPLRFRVTDLGEAEATQERWSGPRDARRKETVKIKIKDREFVAYAVEKDTGEVIEGPPVTISMAVAEGWYGKAGSKWVTMPDLMGRYRAAAFFGRLYAPHILNGMQTDDEILDVTDYREIAPEPVQAVTAEPAPSGRPKGLHAAMGQAKAAEPEKADKPAARTRKAAARPDPVQEDVQDAEIVDERQDDGGHDEGHQDDDQGGQGGDVFGPEDDDGDYQPA